MQTKSQRKYSEKVINILNANKLFLDNLTQFVGQICQYFEVSEKII
jgi:hypothetical protein